MGILSYKHIHVHVYTIYEETRGQRERERERERERRQGRNPILRDRVILTDCEHVSGSA